ncbi:uncharacterized protein LOC116267284 isoform X2 [Nymphaea colorata]|uniref:uncharacterized protein LOC116267284 isoform X2 n=1 Tax=Nymphaea colorata TaxID=210225 RepID=UPI00129E16AC|nr:uncharacterized protein LOC116267284 isoform X2 [Nymphaea colorata]
MEAGNNSDDSLGGSRVIQEYFGTPESSANIPSSEKYGNLQTPEQHNLSFWVKKRLFRPSSLRKMFSLPRIPWISGSENDEKVELTKAEIESIRLEIATAEEREAHLKAQLEHVDEILRSARLAGYLYTRTRWTALPWEPPVDDADIDDWLQHFMVLHGSCIFLYLHSSDLSPQDSILLTEIVEVGVLPSFIHHENETRYSFSMLTRQGLRYECSSSSKVQVDAWLSAIRIECKMDPSSDTPQDSSKL